MQNIADELKKKLAGSVQRNRACALLFSGGLDTSILAALNPRAKAISVSLKSFGEDIHYAKSLAADLNLKHLHRTVEIEEAVEAIPQVIKILQTFDPAIPNDLVVYFGLELAKELGIKEIMTGDASDELFAGYSYMQKIDDLASYLKKISQTMEFSSNKLGEFFKIKIVQPFLNKEVRDFALKVDTAYKIRKQNNRVWGKWILRKAFEDTLPKKVIWQKKRPLEYGSGMTRLRKIINSKVSDSEFEKARKTLAVKFISKEHFYYYKIYKRTVGEIPLAKKGENSCPGCGIGVKKKFFHCGVCGWAQPI